MMVTKEERKRRNEAEFKRIKPKIVRILKKHGITRAGIFGSFARREQNKKSDVDVLIRPTKKQSLFDIAGIELELEEKLNRKVDLVSYKGISPYLKERILQEEVRIF